MVRTKQTQHGGSSTRPTGVQSATFDKPEADQFAGHSTKKTGLTWSNPSQAVEKGEASKSAGKKGEGSQDVGKPTGAEGGAQAPPKAAQEAYYRSPTTATQYQ